MEKVIGVGTTRGYDVDKFKKNDLSRGTASKVDAPLIKECYANIVCRVEEHTARHNYRGDGTFVADGR